MKVVVSNSNPLTITLSVIVLAHVLHRPFQVLSPFNRPSPVYTANMSTVFAQMFSQYLFPSTKRLLVMGFGSSTGLICEDLRCKNLKGSNQSYCVSDLRLSQVSFRPFKAGLTQLVKVIRKKSNKCHQDWCEGINGPYKLYIERPDPKSNPLQPLCLAAPAE